MSTRPGWPVPLHVMSQSDIRDPREAALEERLRLEFGLALWPIAESAGARPFAYRRQRNRRKTMTVVKYTIAAVAATFALAGASAFAVGGNLVTSLTSTANHGSTVSSAARTSCPDGTTADRDAHGDCVSKIARDNHGQSRSGTNGESTKAAGASASDAHGDTVSAAAHSCSAGTSTDRDAKGDCVSKVAKSGSHGH